LNKLIKCKNCGNKFEGCKTCYAIGIFHWKSVCCSWLCFQEYMTKVEKEREKELKGVDTSER